MKEPIESREVTKKEKESLKQKKEKTIQSLREVEHFLHNWKKVAKGLKIYHILKK